jgi:tRNA threonylcarbamoyladenosine biosynthesis protein TsaB
MLFLGIDTSSTAGTVAVTSPDKVLAEWTLEVDRTHARRLLPHIQWMLRESGLCFGDIQGIAVTLGPGSFTGVRIGMTTAKTLALVSGKPLVGIPTLEVLAGNVSHAVGLLCPALDARRGEVYWALFRRGDSGETERLSDDRVCTPDTLLETVPGPALFLGSGASVYGDRFLSVAGHRVVAQPEQNQVRASVLCRLARESFKAHGGTSPSELEAIYVRPSDAERNRTRPKTP